MFIIKEHYVATDANPNFAGEEKTYYQGKSGKLLGDLKGNYPAKWEIEEYGYKTFAAAMRGLKKAIELNNWEMQRGFWKITSEVVEA